MRINASIAAAIVGLALLLVTPAMLLPPMTHDSFGIDLVWADQFTAELAMGNFYPRWLPRSHGGLGSPVFYFYPPFSFYVIGLFGLLGLSTYGSIIAAYFAGFIASGSAMYAWLKERTKSPLLGALLFMASPYHILDFYSRGAIAEFTAISFIPLVALGIHRALRGRYVLFAFAYAALILSHLPLALLVSVFFIAPYSIYLCRREFRGLPQVAIPVALGVALSAIFVVPAVALDLYRDSAQLWQYPAFQPQNWTLLRWGELGPPTALKLLVGTMILVLLQPIIVLLFTPQRKWGAYAGFCCLMAGAFVPVIWQLPLLQAVQFPYRIFPLAEFAIATGIAAVALSRIVTLATILPLLAFSTFFLVGERVRTAPDMPWSLIAVYGDVPENLPPGDRPPSWPSHWALEIARSHRSKSQIGDQTVEPVFYFPAWEVRCQGRRVPTVPEAGTKLLSYKGSDCQRRLILTLPERVGAAISLAGLLILAGIAWAQRRTWMTPTLSE